LYCEIQRIVRLLKVALRKYDFVGSRLGPQPDLQAAGDYGLGSGRRAGLHQALVNQVLELRSPHLESIGAGVRKIVGDIVNVGLLRIHSTGRSVKGSNHFLIPPIYSVNGSVRFPA
jgi:hypothetical protein